MTPTTQDAPCSVSSQGESGLFRLPIEIRRCIYNHFINQWGYHIVSSTEGDLTLTPCLGPSLYDGKCGNERWVSEPVMHPDPESERRYQERLRSSWGPHWMCEEFWLGWSTPVVTWEKAYGADICALYPALRLCKRTYEEVMLWLIAEADLHVMDLETLALLQSPSSRTGGSGSDFCLPNLFVNRIEKLSTTLSRPLAFFRTLETSSFLTSAISSSKREAGPHTKIDSNTSLHAAFPRLRKLLLWLDHTGEEYWSVVNERAILTPILTAATAYPSLDLVVVLPKTHPTLENNEKHFLNDTLKMNGPGKGSASVPIRRVLRQRYRVFGRPGDQGAYVWHFEPTSGTSRTSHIFSGTLIVSEEIWPRLRTWRLETGVAEWTHRRSSKVYISCRPVRYTQLMYK